MMKLITSLMLAGMLAFAQAPDDDAFQNRLQERVPDWLQQHLIDHPNATLERISEKAVHYKIGPKQFKAYVGRGLGHVDADTGQLAVTRPEIWETNNGWAVRGAGARARIVQRPGIGKSDVGAFRKVAGQWRGVALRLPEVTHAGGFSFSFLDGLDWELELHATGFTLTSAPVTTAQGKQTFSWPHTVLNTTIEEDAATGDLTNPSRQWRLTLAVIIGADGVEYPCSAWRIAGQQVRFTCDDSSLPAEAFPYHIDPVNNYVPTASGDDVDLYSLDDASWPPSDCETVYTSRTSEFISMGWNTDFYRSFLYVRYDTSGIPDSATIDSAIAYFLSEQPGVDEQGGSVQGEYYASANWPITCADWTTTPGNDAVSGWGISGFGNNGWENDPMLNVSSISKTTHTGILWSLSGTPSAEALESSVRVRTYDYTGTTYDPYLAVTYTTVGAPMIIVVTDD